MQPTNRITHALNGNNGAAAQPAPGRDGQGRFAKGNPGGPGNPFTRQIAGFRRALCNAVTEQDIQELAQILLAKAKAGDLLAIKLLLQYTIGRPTEAPDPDRLDAQEMQLYRQNNADEETMAELLRGTPADFALTMLRLALPNRGRQLAEYALEHLDVADPQPAPTEAETPSSPAEREPCRAEPAAPMTNGVNGRRKARREPASPPLTSAHPATGRSPAPMTNGEKSTAAEPMANGATGIDGDSAQRSPGGGFQFPAYNDRNALSPQEHPS